MSILHIEEYSTVLKDVNGALADIPHIQTGRTKLTYTTSSVRTSFAFDEKTTYIIVHADADSYVVLGDSNVTSNQNGMLVPQGVFRTFGIQEGATHIAVIQKT